ncbi:MAG: beta-galactosidase trimerization domain-containing protein [Terracidiphilus sp.]
MPAMNRREMLKMTALALQAQGFQAIHANELGLRKMAGQADLGTYEWIHSNRTLIAEAYNPPFYPSFDYEPAKAVSIALDLNCDSMRFPSASYYANFPTQSGYPIHPDLMGDPMRDTLALLRKADMRTIAYIPLNHPFMPEGSKDPRFQDWTRRYMDGSPIITTHYGWTRFYEGCINSPIRDMVRKLVAEVLSYDYDVLYFDGPYQGMDHSSEFCHCAHCQSAYGRRFGKAVPDQRTCSQDERVQYLAWLHEEVLFGFFRELRKMIRNTRDVPVVFNNSPMLSRDESWRTHGLAIVDGFMYEASDTPEAKLFNLQLGKSTGKATWTYLGHHTEYSQEHMKDDSVRGWYSYPVEGQELLLDGAVATAAGVGCVYWGMQRFFYQPEGPQAYASGRYMNEIFTFQQKHHEVLRSLSSRPQVGILVGSLTIGCYAGSHFVPDAYPNYYRGAFNLLKSLSIESEPFLDFSMTEQQLGRYTMVFVPDAACLSDGQCAMLRRYVESGGTLVSTHLTSVADETGRVRSNFGLADVFGATFDDAEPIEYPDLYLKPAQGDLIPQDPQVVRMHATGGTVEATTWDRGNHRDLGPAVVTHRVGKGMSIYIGSGLEAIYEETRLEPVRKYLAGLLLPWLEAGRTYNVDHVPGVTPHYMASEKTIVLYLLADTAGVVHHQKARETFVAVENVKVRLRLSGKIKAVTLMRSGAAVAATRDGEWIAVAVPRLLVYEAIRVDLA